MTSVSQVRSLVDAMNKGSEGYDQKAAQIWSLLDQTERESLSSLVGKRPPWFDGPVVTDPVRKRLIDMGLVSRTSWKGERGYTQISFTGYAAYKAGNPKQPGVTLPGEKRS